VFSAAEGSLVSGHALVVLDSSRCGFNVHAGGVMEWAHGWGEETVQKDFVSERLQVLTEFFKLCWLSIFGVGSGSLSILLGPFALRRYAWAGTGIVLMLALRVLLWHARGKIQRLREELHRIGEPH
jgi:hypothetical protein